MKKLNERKRKGITEGIIQHGIKVSCVKKKKRKEKNQLKAKQKRLYFELYSSSYSSDLVLFFYL